eukprot:TRINITY_DN33287_c0_g1_i1.p1 TRINITY_DN33287_c0_g1~~TRINITY_DN33287_c0_g1_i1.p1  ORF type:complete len:250 (+),score=59.57 TRINITY_DN33287_c0_g1_i1:128-877(+)
MTAANASVEEGDDEEFEELNCGEDAWVGDDERPVDRTFDSVAPGKWDWWDEAAGGGAVGSTQRKQALPVETEAIDTYSWSDGTSTVSVYVELPGLDAVSDRALLVDSGERRVVLTVLGIGEPPKRRRLALVGLFEDVESVRLDRKLGKNTIVLRFQKRQQRPWTSLLASGVTLGGIGPWGGGGSGVVGDGSADDSGVADNGADAPVGVADQDEYWRNPIATSVPGDSAHGPLEGGIATTCSASVINGSG